jgi:two-component system sensor histidine kinase BaeS
VSLGALVDASRRAFAPTAEAGGVTLAVEAPDTVVEVDGTRIRQALDNLLDNALRHTLPGGDVRVTAKLTPDALTIQVDDTGPGFARFTGLNIHPGQAIHDTGAVFM